MAYGSQELVERHLFSMYFMLPLVFICIGFMYHNWYVPSFPSNLITGRRLRMHAGTRHACFPVTRSATSPEWHLLWWASRRIFPRRYYCFSFRKYSTLCCLARNSSESFHVQDTGCRGDLEGHRSPAYLLIFSTRFDRQTNLLHPSKAVFLHPPSKLTTLVLKTLSVLGLTSLTVHPNTGVILEANNLTILNFFLLRLGPMTETRLVQVLMCSQVAFPVRPPSFFSHKTLHTGRRYCTCILCEIWARRASL
jgi:UDP-N-acetylglucosamine--dolichyl-phosphate N-acetylglucosaminephosphotransferase